MTETRDHGGGLDAAIAEFGGQRDTWLDLSTGINPVPYPLGKLPAQAWTALPDQAATNRLLDAARRFWAVPDGAEIVLAPGASALIARMPALFGGGTAYVHNPTYNEHEAAFSMDANWSVSPEPECCDLHIHVHPNNPTGQLFGVDQISQTRYSIVDESFCDTAPERSHIDRSARRGVVVLKSFGKFWGLAGLRLGFAICTPDLADRLRNLLGPWPVSGIALEVGAMALNDADWAQKECARLRSEADRLDRRLRRSGAQLLGGTSLFRLYEVPDAGALQRKLAKHHIWTRTFPYAPTWLRLGLPHPSRWDHLDAALTQIDGTVGGAKPPASATHRPAE